MWFIRTVVWLDNNNNNCYISPPLKYQEGASDMTVTCCVNTNLDQLLVILKFCLNQAREASQQGIGQWPAKSSSDKYYYYANYTFTGTFLIAFSNIVFQSTIVTSSPVINAKIELGHVRTLFNYYFMILPNANFTGQNYVMAKLDSNVTLYPADGFVIHGRPEASCYVMLLANCLQCLKQCNKWITVLATGTFWEMC